MGSVVSPPQAAQAMSTPVIHRTGLVRAVVLPPVAAHAPGRVASQRTAPVPFGRHSHR